MLVTGGNHDHGLIAGGSTRGCSRRPSGFLGLSEPVEPGAGRPARDAHRRARRPGPAAARLPGRVAARRRLRHPRPLPRPALDDADVRAARGGRDGALGRAPARARRPARRLRGRARAALRVPAPAHAALRPRGGERGRGRVRARLGRARGGGAAQPSRARRRARRRLPRRGGAHQHAGARAGRPRPVGQRPAPRRPARDARGAPPARRRRALRALRPHPPLRPVAAGRRGGVDDAGGLAAAQHGLVGLPAALPLRRAERVAVLARARRWSWTATGRRGCVRLLGDRSHAELGRALEPA